MSEHELPDEDAPLSELYRRSAAAFPSPHLDAQVISQARRQSMQIRDARVRRWLPVASVAMMVIVVGVVIQLAQPPAMEPQRLASLSRPAPATPEAPAAASADTTLALQESAPPPAKVRGPRSDEATTPREAERREERAKEKKKAKPAESPFEAGSEEELALSKARVLDEPQGEVESKRQEGVPLAAAKEMAKHEVAATKQDGVATRAASSSPESAEVWLKRIRELYGKGDLDGARRELVAFRKAYPKWVVPKELLSLLPEADR